MKDLWQQFEGWHRQNIRRLSEHFSKVGFRSDPDLLRGCSVLEIEHPRILATITIWNKGDVEVGVLKQGSQYPFYLDDRRLQPEEDITALLDGYVGEIVKLAS